MGLFWLLCIVKNVVDGLLWLGGLGSFGGIRWSEGSIVYTKNRLGQDKSNRNIRV